MAMSSEILLAIIARIEALEGGIEALRRQIADQYGLARCYNFDTRAIKAAIRARADPAGAVEHRAVIERCFEALGEAKRDSPAGRRAPAMVGASLPSRDARNAVAEKTRNEPKLEFRNGDNAHRPQRAIRGP